MKVLAIDTSAKTGSVALLDGETLLLERSYETKESHAEVLVNEIEKALKKAGLGVADIECFAVAIGPGSFTGLRIGLATAKGLAIACGRPVVGVSTLEALASSAQVTSNESLVTIVPCINAYRGEVYVSAKDIIPESSMTPERLCGELLKRGGRYGFIGDGAIQYKEIFQRLLGDRFEQIEKTGARPIAASVARMAQQKIKGGDTVDIASLVPNYIRKSDAELKRSL